MKKKFIRSRKLAAQQLEDRCLLAGSIDLAGNLIIVSGTTADDVVQVETLQNGDISVSLSHGAETHARVFDAGSANTIYFFGGDGNDRFTNQSHLRAIALGQNGNDLLIGGSGRDILLGGSGNDLLRGGDNDDRLFGGTGNDVLLGDRGNDVVQGQDGSDLLIWNNGDGSDVMEGGGGVDFVQVNGANGAGDDFSIDANGNRVRFQRNNLGLFTLNIGTTENLDVNGQGGNDVIIGSVGLAGLISLDLDGGEGNDLLIGGDGVDVLRGGAGNDVLLGGRGNDVVLGQDGNDLLIVNNGDGSDFLEGGEGFDTVQVNGSNAAGDSFRIDANGKRVRFQRTNLGLFALDIGTTENLDVNGQGGDDRVDVFDLTGVADLRTVDVDGGIGNDVINGASLLPGITFLARGGAGNDILFGGFGNDVLLGEEGRDIILGGTGNDFLSGGDGNDILLGGDGNDVILGGNGNDVLSGGRGNDVLLGGSDNDYLNGGAGNDFLDGGLGFDVLLGGADADTLINGENNIP